VGDAAGGWFGATWIPGGWLVGFIVVQRLAELMLARRNTQRLLASGAAEWDATHYPLIVALHAAWIAGLWIFGRDAPLVPAFTVLFALLQLARVWVIASLGARWTTRIIVVPRAVPVRSGPFRWLRHPNYTIVALEMAVAPLALGMPVFAAVFFVLNAAVLWQRIGVENAALAWAIVPAREPARDQAAVADRGADPGALPRG
jgi:methyltransferase